MSREFRNLFWVWMNLKVQSSLLLLAYFLWNMFFIGQNLKHVYMTYSFLELLIFFWLPLADIYCLEFFSHYIKEILDLNINSKRNQSSNRNKVINISFCLWYWFCKILLFFMLTWNSLSAACNFSVSRTHLLKSDL